VVWWEDAQAEMRLEACRPRVGKSLFTAEALRRRGQLKALEQSILPAFGYPGPQPLDDHYPPEEANCHIATAETALHVNTGGMAILINFERKHDGPLSNQNSAREHRTTT
jgi:hypothetical protein